MVYDFVKHSQRIYFLCTCMYSKIRIALKICPIGGRKHPSGLPANKINILK